MGIARWTLVGAALLSSSAATAAEKMKAMDGTVEDVQADKVTVRRGTAKPQVLSLSGGTQFVEARPFSEGDLQKGDRILALVEPQSSGAALVAEIAKASAETATATSGMAPENWTAGSGSAIPSGTGSQGSGPKSRKVAGTVERIEGTTITVRGVNNRQMDLAVTENSRFVTGRPLEEQDLKAGDHVRAFVRPHSGGNMTVVAIGMVPAASATAATKPAEGSTGSGSAIPSEPKPAPKAKE